MVRFDANYEVNERSFELKFDASNSYESSYGEVIEVTRNLPLYDGDMTITPGDTMRVLQTDGKKIVGNIIVNPVPQTYGRISWNGSTLLIT